MRSTHFFFILLGICTASLPVQVIAQHNIFKDELTISKEYKELKVKRVHFLDVKTQDKITHEYDAEGRLIKLIENENPEIATNWIYTDAADKTICRVYRMDPPNGRVPDNVYVIEYDKDHSVTAAYRMEWTRKYLPDSSGAVTISSEDPILFEDTVRVLKLISSYEKGQEIVQTFAAGTTMTFENLIRNYRNLNYVSYATDTFEQRKSETYAFDSHIADYKIIFADSVWYENSREVKRVQFCSKLFYGGTIRKNFQSVKARQYDNNGFRERSSITYLDERGRLHSQHWPDTYNSVNEKGLPVKAYNLFANKQRVATDITEYEYFP